METRVPRFTSVLGIFLLFACFSSQTEAAFDPESFQQKLVALQKVLDYMNDRPRQMNLDAAFGVTLTEANLVAALLHENVQHLENKFFIALKEIVALSDLTRRNLMTTIAKNETRSLMLTTLNNPNLWIKPISWTRVLSRSRSSPSQLLSYWEVVRSMWHGTPNETESDQCLVKIMRSSLKEKCEIPATCVATLTKEDDATGYPLTHRLLIVQVAKAVRYRLRGGQNGIALLLGARVLRQNPSGSRQSRSVELSKRCAGSHDGTNRFMWHGRLLRIRRQTF
ncbi:uncharacterized protein LOC143902281 isoform X2 [Temnothorax americanus]|uniref:uncharacterized protein LOC143902281 isoform X2 n=1 Tax=Temnothorax americanus TaxID=1964332 RepID=UPI004067DA1E